VLYRLWSFLTGYVTLVVKGGNLEKLINMAVSRGLYLWDIRRVDPDTARVKLRLNGIKALRHIARVTRCRFRITGKSGLPFKVARLKKSKTLLAGAVISALLVYIMSSFIWFVEVRGNKNIPADRVEKIAGEAGLAIGTLKAGLNKDSIEKYIRNEIPGVAWVGIKITGTKAIIEIAEKIIIPPVDNSPANVVAEKAGLIQDLLVLSGKPVVSEGEMVRKGDVLITGCITPEPKPGEKPDGENRDHQVPLTPVRLVRAKGIVRAKVWYEGYGECSLVDQGTKRTGKETQVVSIRVFGKALVIKGPKRSPYRDFVTSTNIKKLPEWRNINIPVEVVTTNYYEVEKYRDIIDISDAKSRARDKALAGARTKVPSDARIVREISEEIFARGSNIIRVKAVLEVIEEIGSTEPLKQEVNP